MRVSAFVLALIVLSLRFASPYLHNHGAFESSLHHAVVQADGCPSCDADATYALQDAAPAVLPSSEFLYSLLPTEQPLTANQSLAQRLDVGRAPPSLLA